MDLKLVATTRMEKQFDILVSLGTHLKARPRWLVKKEDGTLILPNARVNYCLELSCLRWLGIKLFYLSVHAFALYKWWLWLFTIINVIVHFMFENLKENFKNPHHLSIGQNLILNVDYKSNHLCVAWKE